MGAMSDPQDRIAHVSWEEGRAANLANWEDRVPIHEVGYGVASGTIEEELSDVVTHAELAAIAGSYATMAGFALNVPEERAR